MIENDLVKRSISLLKKEKYCKEIKKEIPFLSRCIDVVYINQYDEVVSIEFKIKDVHHAIEQAKNHKLGADKSYICLPKRKLSEKTMNEIINENLGLLFYDSHDKRIIEEIAPPKIKTNANIFKKLLLLNYNRI